MRIIIAPAKKMNMDDTLEWHGLPQFLPQTRQLLETLQRMSYEELKKLWGCNDSIAALNFQRLKGMQLTQNLTPAILSYEGIQYQRMAPGVFTYGELEYIEEHLRILSGFYGMVRPFDGVTPYRLEMQAKLQIDGKANLYAFWGDRLTRQLEQETDTILNLASYEYSKAVSKHLSPGTRMVTCVFAERKGEKLIEKGTICKMARGEMVRFMAVNRIEDPTAVQAFTGLGFRFHLELSDETQYIFIKE